MSHNDIAVLFEEWNSALQTGEPKKVTALYEGNGILLPTVSNKVRHNHDEIEDYFVHFLTKGPKGTIEESNMRTFGDTVINSGTYQSSFNNGSRELDTPLYTVETVYAG